MTSEEHGKLRPLGRDYLAGTSNVLLEQLGVTDAQEEVLINGIIALFGPPFYDEAPGERLVRALKCASRSARISRCFAREGSPSRPA